MCDCWQIAYPFIDPNDQVLKYYASVNIDQVQPCPCVIQTQCGIWGKTVTMSITPIPLGGAPSGELALVAAAASVSVGQTTWQCAATTIRADYVNGSPGSGNDCSAVIYTTSSQFPGLCGPGSICVDMFTKGSLHRAIHRIELDAAYDDATGNLILNYEADAKNIFQCASGEWVCSCPATTIKGIDRDLTVNLGSGVTNLDGVYLLDPPAIGTDGAPNHDFSMTISTTI